MSIIDSIGSSNGLLHYPTSRRDNEQAQFRLELPENDVQKTRQVAANEPSAQAVDEAFARMRIAMSSRTDEAQSSEVSIDGSRSENKQKDVVAEFMAYMAKSPAEKVQDSMLKEMGLTKEEFDALPPEEQNRIAEEIARRMQERMEVSLQANGGQAVAVMSALAEFDPEEKTGLS